MREAREVIARAACVERDTKDGFMDCDGQPCPGCNKDADAILAALAAAGLAVVPVEPTKAMLTAAVDRAAREESVYHGIWRAMCAAAQEDQR